MTHSRFTCILFLIIIPIPSMGTISPWSPWHLIWCGVFTYIFTTIYTKLHMAPCVEVELNRSMWVHNRNLAFPQYKYYWLSFLSRVVPADILLQVKLFLLFKSKGCCIASYWGMLERLLKPKGKFRGKLQGLWIVRTPHFPYYFHTNPP